MTKGTLFVSLCYSLHLNWCLGKAKLIGQQLKTTIKRNYLGQSRCAKKNQNIKQGQKGRLKKAQNKSVIFFYL